jgi:hypothetical protein
MGVVETLNRPGLAGARNRSRDRVSHSGTVPVQCSNITTARGPSGRADPANRSVPSADGGVGDRPISLDDLIAAERSPDGSSGCAVLLARRRLSVLPIWALTNRPRAPSVNFRCLHIESCALIVKDCDVGIRFFIDAWVEVVEDSPATTNDGRPKRRVIVRPPRSRPGCFSLRPTARAKNKSSTSSLVAWGVLARRGLREVETANARPRRRRLCR